MVYNKIMKTCIWIAVIALIASTAVFATTDLAVKDNQIVGGVMTVLKYVQTYSWPVAVIVLGILDFIKAIATDKDDEMKKAQKRFIIRLIAAALIFIIPFIIEFVLDKMGFIANGCGIINL